MITESEASKPEWSIWIPAIGTAIGAIITLVAGLIVLWVKSAVDKSAEKGRRKYEADTLLIKRRKTIMYEMIRSTYEFFAFQKMHVNYFGFAGMYSQKIALNRPHINNTRPGEPTITREGFDELLELHKTKARESDDSFVRMVQIETALQTLVVEVGDLYSKEIYDVLTSAVKSMFKLSNGSPILTDWTRFDIKNIDAEVDKFPKALDEINSRFDESSADFISIIERAMKAERKVL